MPRPLVLDCDPGIDDMIAILVACASPEIELCAVTTVGGNAGLATTTRNARAVLALAGRESVPVAAGAARSLVRTAPRGAERVHGANGLGGLELPEPVRGVDPRPAVRLLADVVTGAREPVTLVATGPLTNVALFYACHPDLAARLDRVVVMGGAIGAGTGAEFNVSFDPEAAYRVLTDPGVAVPTTMVGLDVTLRTTLREEELDRLAGHGHLGRLAVDALRGYRHGYPGDGVPVHDAVALAGAIVPELLTTRATRVRVDTSDGPERGVTRAEPGAGPAVHVAVDADVPAVRAFLLDRLARLAVAAP